MAALGRWGSTLIITCGEGNDSLPHRFTAWSRRMKEAEIAEYVRQSLDFTNLSRGQYSDSMEGESGLEMYMRKWIGDVYVVSR